MLIWELEIFGESELLNGLQQLEDALSSFREPLEKSAERAVFSVQENIARGGIPEPFAPLAPSTLYQTSSYRLGGPLYRQGDLLEGAGILEVTDDSARAGYDESTEQGRIAGYMTRGDNGQNRPPRPFVRVLDSDVDAIQGYFVDYIDNAIARAFSSRRFA